ncbi:MFS transporter [Williamsia sp. CHRR-6]|uniref:MFS transporter n=1 Tax=Williamsia sp. CHRR-6 TaxID=2835871 RepID=UPI001BD9402A|nr:MFS transporter [Williamsia sp. CHRR-6]MBT0566834.1 MFS transporter [Williamsia sp. CHRR-6]
MFRLGRPFAYFYAAFVCSGFGDAFRVIAVAVWLFEATDGAPLQRFAVVLLATVPGLVLGGFAGIVADRFDRFTVLVTADVLRAFVGIGLAVCAGMDAPIPAMILLTTGTCLGVFFSTSAFAAVPTLVEASRLPRANGLMETSSWVLQAVGASAGSLVLTYLHAPVAFLIDGVTFLVSALLLTKVRSKMSANKLVLPEDSERPITSDDAVPRVRTSVVDDLLEGLRFIWKNHQIRALLYASYGVGFLVACTSFGLIFLIADSLDQPPASLGYVMAFNGIVATLSAAVATVTLKPSHYGAVFSASILALVIAQVTMGISPNVIWLLAGVAISAVANSYYNISVTTLYMSLVPNSHLGRVEGTDVAIDSCVTILGYGFSFVVVAFFDARWLFVVSGVLAIPALIVTVRQISRVDIASG